MPTQAGASGAAPSQRRVALADRGSEENSHAARPTGKGTPARTPNSRFKKKAALAVLDVKRIAGTVHRGSPSKSMLTPGGVRRARQSGNRSGLVLSQQGAPGLVPSQQGAIRTEPSFDQSIENTSSILSENSTMILGCENESLGHSFTLSLIGRESLDSSRDSISSARLSTGTFLGGLAAVTDGLDQDGNPSLLQTKFVDLQNENKALRTQLDSFKVSCLASWSDPVGARQLRALLPRPTILSHTLRGCAYLPLRPHRLRARNLLVPLLLRGGMSLCCLPCQVTLFPPCRRTRNFRSCTTRSASASARSHQARLHHRLRLPALGTVLLSKQTRHRRHHHRPLCAAAVSSGWDTQTSKCNSSSLTARV